MMFSRKTFADVLREERVRVREANDCHTPAGSPQGGQFCSKGGAGSSPYPRKPEDLSKNPAPYSPAPGEGYKPALTPDEGRAMARRLKQEQDEEDAQRAAPKKVRYKVTAPTTPSGPQHIADYRGMEIHTLPSYTTPYYFVNAPGFGSMQHSRSLARIKRQIDTFKDTGQTARGAERAKASARYQKRKARGY